MRNSIRKIEIVDYNLPSVRLKLIEEAKDYLIRVIMNDGADTLPSQAAHSYLGNNYEYVLMCVFNQYENRYKDLIMYSTPIPTPSEFIPRLSQAIMEAVAASSHDDVAIAKISETILGLLYSRLPKIITEVIRQTAAISPIRSAFNSMNITYDVKVILRYLKTIIYFESNPAVRNNEYFRRASLLLIETVLVPFRMDPDSRISYAEYIYLHRSGLAESRYDLVNLLHSALGFN